MNNFFQGTPKKEDNQPNQFGMNMPSQFQNTNQPQQSSSIVPFPGTQNPQQNSSMIGQNTTGIFGSSQPTLNTFGTTNFGSFPNTSTFGSSRVFPTNSTPFGTSTPSFGSSNTPGVTPTFGNSNATSMTSNFGSGNTPGITPSFGTSSNTSGITPPSFGNTTSFPSQTPFGGSSSFSSQQPSFGSSNMFSQPNTSSSPFSSSNTFGSLNRPSFSNQSTAPSTTSWSAPSLSAWGGKDKGSKVVPYSSTRIMDDNNVFVELNHINGMKEYFNKPVDEIRKEDYEMSLCPPKPTTSPFGSASSTGSFMGFNSQPSTTSGIGLPFAPLASNQSQFTSTSQPTPFGSGMAKPVTPLGSSFPTPLSNTTNTQTSSTFPFGSATSNTLNTVPSSTTQFPPFGQPQPSSLFNQNTAPSPFGQTSNPVFPQNPSTNTFQQPTSSPLFNSGSTGTTSSIFQQQPNNTLMSQTSDSLSRPTGLFNNSMQQPSSSLFQPKPELSNFTNPFGSAATSQFKPTSMFGGETLQSSPFSQQNAAISTPFAQPTGAFMPATQPNNRDPYLLKDIKFDKFEQQKPNVRIPLPTPIFKSKRETPLIDLKIRPPKPLTKNSFYTIPDIRELNSLQSISNLVIGFEGKGRIEFLEPVTLSTPDDIEKRVSFRNENVEVSDPIGTGLNKKARVYVEGLYPMCRTTNEVIKGKADAFPQKGIQERFIYQLKNDSTKKFIDYNVDTGIYVYEVNHF